MRIDLPWLFDNGFKRLLTPIPYVMLNGHGMFLEFDRKKSSWRATVKENGDCHYVETRKEVQELMEKA